MHTQHDEKGNPESHTVNVTTCNKDDEVISSTSITNNADGTRTETTTSADGSRVQKTFDKDGKLVSTTEYPASDDEAKDTPEEGNGEFWDVDIIYGDHPDMVQSSDMVADLKMAMEMDPALEMYVDHFDFIM
ncbi:hypothetical protein KUL25_18030 [Rhodobacteraceae bacterium N5(2021)]|uniref:Uncharacterized protein n=1 Tax=Gymnodinialimonas phycosphaerae TaxID=2841589 RepID=A0A975TU71_9RHOB|nr:hypothetical protein [Gymnodinialimonas phycosphaerae]MBY4894662.1 hypothetical protein [Gymnodinialimonas phycosphaerae]